MHVHLIMHMPDIPHAKEFPPPIDVVMVSVEEVALELYGVLTRFYEMGVVEQADFMEAARVMLTKWLILDQARV